MNKKKILIVDDSEVVLRAIRMRLESKGYEVLTALDGAGAVSTARRESPDLILLDLSFPPDVAHGGGVSWDGFVIMQWLRRLDEAKNIPIIVVTGGDPVKYKDRALTAGASGFFNKPISSDELLTMVRQTLEEADRKKEAAAPAV